MENSSIRNVSDILFEKKWDSRPLRIISEKYDNTRFNLVTDDIDKESLTGRVAALLILTSMVCRKNDWTLRIITRKKSCNLYNYYEFAEKLGIECPEKVESYSDEYYHSDVINYRLGVSDKDVFFAASWQNAKSLLETNIRDRIIYLVKEDESCLYPQGDKRLWCREILNSENIDYLICTEQLYKYFSSIGFDNMIKNGLWFEPAFPAKPGKNAFAPKKDGKLRMLIAPGCMQHFCLECIEEAISRNIIDTKIWDIYTECSDMENIRFSDGYISRAYKEDTDIDLAVCLTDSADTDISMLCLGAAVLSIGSDKSRGITYSENVILAELVKEDVLKKLEQAVSLAGNYDVRKKNHRNIKVIRDWSKSFEDIIPALEERIKEGRYV